MPFNGLAYRSTAGVLVRFFPDRESKPSGWSQDPTYLRKSAFGMGQVENPKIHRHRVETSRLERKLVGVGFTEVEVWIPSSGRQDHLFREVNTGRGGSNPAGLFRDVAWATGHVQQSGAG